jgi:Serine kinase of the HPr protein, regulates carbohydrate metabolism
MILDDVVATARERVAHVDLAYVVELPVLGILTRFETNSRDVLSLVDESFGTWARLPSVAVDTSTKPRVRVAVYDGKEGDTGRSSIHHSLPDARRVVARSAASMGISNPDCNEAVAEVTSELVADSDYFRDEMLQAITLALLSSYDRHFLHAAAVARGDRAIILAGPSGIGKSTLAYLAHRSGFEVMSEDRVWIQRLPATRVWGWPARLHLRAESVHHFPELGGSATRSHGAAKERHVVDIASSVAVPRFYADDVEVCLLSRCSGPPWLERVSADVILEALCRDVAPGFDRHSDRHVPSVRAIAGSGGWRLHLSGDPHEALPLLERMLSGFDHE